MAVGARAGAVGVALGMIVLAASAASAAPTAAVVVAAPVAAGAPALPAAPVPAAPVPPAPSAPSSWAPAATAAIRPGVATVTAGGGACTANFVFTSGRRTFIGQAAHCAASGGPSEVDGCRSGPGAVGSAVRIEAADGTDRTGTLAYSSWAAMQTGGETDPDACAYNDFALVELDPADVADVNPSVPFFGGPTGIDTDGLRAGEEVFTYGGSHQPDGAGELDPKVGVSADDLGGGRGHELYTTSPGTAGDSGSAFLDGDGDAVGILSTLNLDPLPVSNGVSDIARALDYANAHGGLGEIELVLGTEPFTVEPAGVAATELAPPAGPPIGG